MQPGTQAKNLGKIFGLRPGILREGNLLDFDLGADRFDLFLDLFGFFLGDALLEGFGSALDERLGLCETEAGNSGADFLDDRDLVAARPP